MIPADGNTYVGAPGAVLDGRRVNGHAFDWYAPNVTIRHLTIQHFGESGAYLNQGAVNHEHADGWIIERNTIRENAGAAIVSGAATWSGTTASSRTGQYGINTFKATGVTIDRNEIARNNADDWESRIPLCGCSGASKFWMSTGVAVTGNWVHDDRGPGLWVDTNNVGYRIEGNYIEGNDGEGIYCEISYNASIVANTLKGNALLKGRAFAAAGNGFRSSPSTSPRAAATRGSAGGRTRPSRSAGTTWRTTGGASYSPRSPTGSAARPARRCARWWGRLVGDMRARHHRA